MTTELFTTLSTTNPPIGGTCSNYNDCNNPNDSSRSNICINLNSLRENKGIGLSGTQGSDSLFKTMQFLAKKDPNLLGEYNKLAQFFLFPPSNFQQLLEKYKITESYFKYLGVCLCDSNYKGPRCQEKQNYPPNQCDISMKQPACNPNTGIYRPSTFLLTNTLQDPNNTTYTYNSYYCECKANGIIGLNCEYQNTQCQIISANSTSSPSFLGVVEQQKSVCNQCNK